MRYVSSKASLYYDEVAFRNYIADGLKILTENTSSDKERYRLSMRFYDLLHGKKPEPEKSATEIISEIRAAIEGD